MRPVLAGDVFALAHAIEEIPVQERFKTCAILIEETDFADKYRKQFGLLHPVWGNGSLMGRVGQLERLRGAAPSFQSPDFCASVVTALEALTLWRDLKSRRSGQANLPIPSEISELSPSIPALPLHSRN